MMGTVGTPRQPLPVGFRFQPTDKEVFDHYLELRNMGLLFSNDVPDIEMNKLDPWVLQVQFEDELSYQGNNNDWWFFSPRIRNKKTPRLTDSGKWESTCLDKKIPDDKNQVMGIMTSFVFHCRQGQGQYKRFAKWKLYEYRLTNERLDGSPLLDENVFVLCHLKRDNEAKSKTDVQDRQTNGEIPIEVQPRQRKRMTTEMELVGAGAPFRIRTQENFPFSYQLQHNLLHSSEPQSSGYIFDIPQLGEPSLLSPQPEPFAGTSTSLQKNTHVLLNNRRTESSKSVSGVVPAEEKKTCAENRIARPEALPPLSPDIVEKPKNFKASNSPASAESLSKDEARVVKKEPPAANPRWKVISVAKIEEDEELAQETTEKLRLNTGPILITQNQNSLSSRLEYSVNMAVGLVLAFLICSQMPGAAVLLLVLMLLIRLLMKSESGSTS